MKTPFLKKLAKEYIRQEADNLVDYTFVFPNRRSTSFFKKYLIEESRGRPMLLPEITTISDFISEQSGLTEASRVELLIILYHVFVSLEQKKSFQNIAQSFDNFLFWGDMILSDFNDIDRYMVDAKELFNNLTNFKEIESTYQTEEQLRVIKEFWGVDKTINTESFWDKGNGKSSFFHLWNSLFELYSAFKKQLQEKQMAYSGMNYREAVEQIRKKEPGSFGFKRVIFVGFSTLSKSEESIFIKFRDLGLADFYWDFETPFVKGNKGTLFLAKYVNRYPSIYNITDKDVMIPNINILSVPSGSGQGLVVQNIISELIQKEEIGDTSNAIDTAIVLPEEKYLNAVLNAVPTDVKSLNITMGYPFSQTPIVSLISQLSILHSKKRIVQKVESYFFEDVEALVSHPYIKAFNSDAIMKMLKEARRDKLFFIPQKYITDRIPELSVVFKNTATNTEEAFAYIKAILSKIEEQLRTEESSSLERYFVVQYEFALQQIHHLVKEYNIGVDHQSILFLMTRSMAGATVPFEGEPLRGLQIMGVLETRLLDFKNLIVLSMNEKIFPTKHYTKSFIPNFLRCGYGMATYEYQDAMYSYYFYRMISRAENVYLLYDSRNQGISSGEESRYIYQLEKVYNRGANRRHVYKFNIKTPDSEVIELNKTERVMSLLEKYRQKGSDKYLSASSINTYIDCPIKFYLTTIEGLREEDEMEDFIDSATFGTIVHSVMEQIYNQDVFCKVISDSFFQKYIKAGKSTIALQKIISQTINKEYNHLADIDRPLSGDGLLVSSIVSFYVQKILNYDLGLCPFTYIASEKKQSIHWTLNAETNCHFNFKFIIDRIDKRDGLLRIIDYKTGSDQTKAKGLESLLNQDGTHSREKAIMQLMLYCNAYAQAEDYHDGIKPVIYQIRKINITDSFDVTYDSHIINNYLTDFDNADFLDRLTNIIKELFNPEVPFRQTDNKDICKYCQFVEFCGRFQK